MMKKTQIWKNLSKPELVFILLGLFFGFILVFLTPPFQSPDEAAHFERAYQVSQGKIIAKVKGNQIGGLMPQSIKKIADDFDYSVFRLENNHKQEVSELFSLAKYSLNKQDKTFISFPNTALYSPIPYLSSAVGILIGRIFSLPPLIIMYLARLFNLSVWLALIYFAIKKTPVLKWTLLLLALMPMTLFLGASLSADAVTTGISFLFIAFVLNLAFGDKKILENKDIVILLILTIIIALSKQAYFIISLLIFIIPRSKFGSTKKYLFTTVSFILLALMAMIGWSLLVKNLYLPLRPGVDAAGQGKYIFSHPFSYCLTMIETLKAQGKFVIGQFVGVLGSLDTPIPRKLMLLYLIILSMTTYFDINKKIIINIYQRLFGLGIFLIGVFILVTSQYLIWTPVGAKLIDSVQGRYFIPLAPLFFLILYSNRNLIKNKNYLYLFITSFSIIQLIILLLVILKRYYI